MNPLRHNLAVDREGRKFGTGWFPEIPDLRDYSEELPEIKGLTDRLGIPRADDTLGARPAVDLRQFFSRIENQHQLGSCTANAAAGVVEYYERRAFGQHLDASRLFIYKTTRNLMGVTGDTGAWLRNTMGALALCGVADEQRWPYTDDPNEFDKEPPAFIYAIADNFEALRYFCHDPIALNRSRDLVLSSIKRFLRAGVPSMFGFFGFDSFDASGAPGEIPIPVPGEQIRWGHAIVAVGYDDRKSITNTISNESTEGALRIRNSWGQGWGDRGYGWIPYEYVLRRLALDFWSLLRMKWVDTKQFGFDQ